jgi:hypothetical protein
VTAPDSGPEARLVTAADRLRLWIQESIRETRGAALLDLDTILAALPAAAPAEGLRLAPSVYAQGHGLPDHWAIFACGFAAALLVFEGWLRLTGTTR